MSTGDMSTGESSAEKATPVLAPIVASVWKILVERGGTVGQGDTLAVLESMKMEIPVQPGQIVQEGDVVMVLR